MNPRGTPRGPRTRSATEAVEWGRERAPIVMIRPEDDQSRTYWAGRESPTGEFAHLPIWPEV
jgi:hypothetical protein